MKRVFIVAARRTPVARVGGPLKSVPPEALAAAALRAVVDELGGPADHVDDVLLGNAVGPGGNLARLAVLQAGLPLHVPGGTVDRQCGSGLSSVLLAASTIRAGEADLILAGGVESASRAPWKVERPVSLYGPPPRFLGRAPFAPPDIGDPEMGEAAENLAERFGISREAQDDYAMRSHRRFAEAVREQRFAAELAPVAAEGGVMVEDEAARGARQQERWEALRERLAGLKPAFRPGGTVTAGNSCGIHDGAAVLALASEQAVMDHGWTPLAELRAGVTVGVDPRIPGIGPAIALQRCLERGNLSVADLDLVEINEAFACLLLACSRAASLSLDTVNVGGGALAFGHPFGASGAIILVRLVRELARLRLRRGAAAIGIGGGLGAAVVVERPDDRP